MEEDDEESQYLVDDSESRAKESVNDLSSKKRATANMDDFEDVMRQIQQGANPPTAFKASDSMKLQYALSVPDGMKRPHAVSGGQSDLTVPLVKGYDPMVDAQL